MPIIQRGKRKRLCDLDSFPSDVILPTSCRSHDTVGSSSSQHGVDELGLPLDRDYDEQSAPLTNTQSMHVDLNFNEPQASDICMHEIKEGSSSDEADVHSLSEPSDSLDGGVSISGSFPNPGPSDGTGGCIPYCGEVRGGTYNTQALFAATAKKHT